MSTASNEGDRIPMSQGERDGLASCTPCWKANVPRWRLRSLLRLTPRHVHRLLQRLQTGGDAALIHGLRGQPSNYGKPAPLRRRVLQLYRKDYPDFGPTFAD